MHIPSPMFQCVLNCSLKHFYNRSFKSLSDNSNFCLILLVSADWLFSTIQFEILQVIFSWNVDICGIMRLWILFMGPECFLCIFGSFWSLLFCLAALDPTPAGERRVFSTFVTARWGYKLRFLTWPSLLWAGVSQELSKWSPLTALASYWTFDGMGAS